MDKNVCDSIFIIAKTYKEPKYPFSVEQINVIYLRYSYNGILYNNNKNKLLLYSTTWMNQRYNVERKKSDTKEYICF